MLLKKGYLMIWKKININFCEIRYRDFKTADGKEIAVVVCDNYAALYYDKNGEIVTGKNIEKVLKNYASCRMLHSQAEATAIGLGRDACESIEKELGYHACA